MNNFKRIFIIASHEFMALAGKKSFLVMTLLIPIIGFGCMALPLLLMEFNKGDVENVAIIDQSGGYGKAITDNEEFIFQDLTPIGTEGLREFYEQQEGLYAVVVLPADVDSSLQVSVYSDNSVRSGLQNHVARCLNDTITKARIASYDIPQLSEIIDNSQAEVDLTCIKWDEQGNESESDSDFASFVGIMLALFTYMFTLMYGGTILSSVIEEKTNRIVEVMVSCCRPIELLLGKIIGVGFVGIVQIIIWCVLMGIVSAALGLNTMMSHPEMMTQMPNASEFDMEVSKVVQSLASINLTWIAVCAIIYFIGGYLLYGSLFAGAGSTIDQPNESGQVTMPLMMFLVFALWVGLACMENPDGQLAWWCSMIPFTSPIVMMVRLPYDVPFWEVALSVALLFASAFGVAALAAKIYRKGILLYGKKFSWKTILMWLK